MESMMKREKTHHL